MDYEIINTFILNHRQYSCTKNDWRRVAIEDSEENDENDADPLSLKWIHVQKGELYHDDYIPRVSATYEFSDQILYLKKITFRNKAFDFNFEFTPAPKKTYSRDGKLETIKIWAHIGYTGRIRLVRDAVKDPRFYANREKTIAFKTILDIILQNDRILNINDRAKELDQRRRELIKKSMSSDEVDSILTAYPDLDW